MYIFFFSAIPLPVTPATLDITTPSLNETVTLINHGEINIPRTGGLREISFDFLLPSRKYNFSNYSLGDYTATTFIPLINKWKDTKLPFQFIVSRVHGDNQIQYFTNIKVLVESFTYKEDATQYGTDTLCSITLKEYKDYPTTLLEVIKKTAVDAAVGVAATVAVAATQKKRSTTSKIVEKTYVVKKGDTLWSICKKELGDGQKYKEVAKLNNIENPDLIHPGQKLRLS